MYKPFPLPLLPRSFPPPSPSSQQALSPTRPLIPWLSCIRVHSPNTVMWGSEIFSHTTAHTVMNTLKVHQYTGCFKVSFISVYRQIYTYTCIWWVKKARKLGDERGRITVSERAIWSGLWEAMQGLPSVTQEWCKTYLNLIPPPPVLPEVTHTWPLSN